MQEGTYNIKAVSKKLGIQPGTLRAWERRYQFIEPMRNEAGHRLYTEKQVTILKWLTEKVEQGFTISQAVAVLEKTNAASSPLYSGEVNQSQTQLQCEELIDAVLQFRENKANQIINQMFSLYTMEKVIDEMLGGVLIQMGDKLKRGEILAAQERFASSIIQSRIRFIMHTFPTSGLLSKVITICASGETEELRLLLFTLFLKQKGYETIYLGQPIEKEDLLTTIAVVQPAYLFLSCLSQENVKKALVCMEEVEAKFPNIKVGIVGAVMTSQVPEYHQGKFIGTVQVNWEEWLKR